ncbi:phage tail tip lysozyme [Commensalibacter papalotli (ex Servin-Garciduenas et al. 2014)]|uniref:phage tail tip lysozyme n=1 Tax=Commensalibacter papalotli (ex Servin-Garciduenas et al. 2014) TaxID=1208583 RepID=UPI0004B28744|nr:phage tail tip lysozyme [Commensalibacter papalotli (ex Servin-Garciduenas et al. 2014)]
MPNNPIQMIQRPKNPKARDRRISEQEKLLIVNQLSWDMKSSPKSSSQWTAFAFCLAIETAMRRGELCCFTWGDLHLDEAYIHLETTKNGDERDVPLSSKAKAMPANAKLDAERQKLRTAYETAEAKAIEAITPTAIDFMKALTGFVSNYPSLAMATTAITTFGGSIFGLLTILKLSKGLLPGVGIAATKTAPKSGLGSALWRGAKWGGNKVWDGTKWIAGKGVEASEWAERNPKAIAKGGGRLAGVAPMVAWDLTGGNITDAQSTSMWDGISRRDKNGQWNRNGRARNIERELNARVLQSSWNNKYYVQTKGGVYVYIDSQFYEPIEQIKRRLDNKQIDIPNQPSTSVGKTIADAIIPSARAGDRVPVIRSGGGKLNSSAVQSAFKILTSKDENGSFTDEQAKGIIANLMGESGKGLNHQAIGDGGKAFGVAQWHSDRQANFERIFGHDIRQSTLEEQIKFLKWEMQNTEKAAGDKIRKATNANQATIASVAYYERPKDIQGQSIERMGHIVHVNRALNQNKVNISPYQRQAQMKQAQANNTTHNINNSPTVNINVTNGSVENVKKAVKQAVGYPSARNFNGISGMS